MPTLCATIVDIPHSFPKETTVGRHSDNSVIGSMTIVDPLIERFQAEVAAAIAPLRYRAIVALRRQGHDHFAASEMVDQAILDQLEEGFGEYE